MKWRKDPNRPYMYQGFTFDFSEYYEDPTMRRKQTSYGAKYDPEFEERLEAMRDDAMFDQMLQSRGGRYDNVIDRYFFTKEFFDAVDHSTPEYWMSVGAIIPERHYEKSANSIYGTVIPDGIIGMIYQKAAIAMGDKVRQYVERYHKLSKILRSIRRRYSMMTNVQIPGDVPLPKWVSKPFASDIEDSLATVTVQSLFRKYNDENRVVNLPLDTYREVENEIMRKAVADLDQMEWDLDEVELKCRNYYKSEHAIALGTLVSKEVEKIEKTHSMFDIFLLLYEHIRISRIGDTAKLSLEGITTKSDMTPVYLFMSYLTRCVGMKNIVNYDIHTNVDWMPPDERLDPDVMFRVLGHVMERNSAKYNSQRGKIYMYNIVVEVSHDVADSISGNVYRVKQYKDLCQKAWIRGKAECEISKVKKRCTSAFRDYLRTFNDEERIEAEFRDLLKECYNELFAAEIEAKRREERRMQRALEQQRLLDEEQKRERELQRIRRNQELTILREKRRPQYEEHRAHGLNVTLDQYCDAIDHIPDFDEYLIEYWSIPDSACREEATAIINRLLSEGDCDSDGMGSYTADLEFPRTNQRYAQAICRIMSESKTINGRIEATHAPGAGRGYMTPKSKDPLMIYAILRYLIRLGYNPIITVDVEGNLREDRVHLLEIFQ